MSRPLGVVAAVAVLIAAVPLAGCGSTPGPTPEAQVRTTMADLGRATAAKDYRTLCTRVLAPRLVAQVTAIGLPCETALRKGLGDVQQPRLQVGRIRVDGTRATAEVSTSAAGQAPSKDVVQLVLVDGAWRVSSLAGQSPSGPSPTGP